MLALPCCKSGASHGLIARADGESEASATLIVPADWAYGLGTTCSVVSVTGNNSLLTLGIDSSIDGTHWSSVAGDVSITAIGTFRIERHLVGPYVRITIAVSGPDSPIFVYSLKTEWLATHVYSPLSGDWHNAGPFTWEAQEGFTFNGEPGTTVNWSVKYFDSEMSETGEEGGSEAVSSTGTATASVVIPTELPAPTPVWARLSFDTGLPGQDAVTTADVSIE